MGQPDAQPFADLVPLALGLAVSPLPVATVMMLLVSARARTVGRGFAIGFLGGIVAALLAGVLLSASLPAASSAQAGFNLAWLRIGIGCLLLALGLHRLIHRVQTRREKGPPRWLKTLDRLTFGRAVALGLLLSAGNPKNLPIALAAGVTIAATGSAPSAAASAFALFALLSTSTVLAPVVVHRIAPGRTARPFRHLRATLVRHGPTAMVVVLLVVGSLLLAQGLVRLQP